jgi:MoaA/NifB/PqqE/SkfB family radical SAM enzyme
MNKITKKIKLFIAIITKSTDYSTELVKDLYKIYLNHNKIIHFRNGYPVYSISTPPLFSRPSANFLARLVYQVIQNRPFPGLMSFAVNDICNAKCNHCSFYNSVDDKTKKVLNTTEAKDLIRQAQELGVSVINFVGGEPLMRPDLPELVKEVNKDISVTSIFTNGWFLSDRIKELKDAGLDSVYVSIDSAIPSEHDKKRGVFGLFDKAIEGILKAKQLGFTTGISCCLTEEEYKNGDLDKIIELAKEKSIHEVLVFDALPVGKYKDRTDLKGHKKWVEEMIQYVKKFNDDESYPGVLIYAYTASHRSVGCSGGTSYMYMTPYGEICPCDFYHKKFGSIREYPLWKLWENMTLADDFGKSKWGGCRVKEEGDIIDNEENIGCSGCSGCA